MRDSWKNLNFTISKFWAQRYADNMTNKRWKASSKRSGAHFRSGSEMVSEEFAKCYTKRTTATANSPDLNILECHWRDSVQRSSPQNTGRAQKATQLCLEKCDLTKLAHSIPHRLENVKNNKGPSWLLIFLLFNIKWKRNDIPNCKKN